MLEFMPAITVVVAFEKNGFELEGTLRQEMVSDGSGRCLTWVCPDPLGRLPHDSPRHCSGEINLITIARENVVAHRGRSDGRLPVGCLNRCESLDRLVLATSCDSSDDFLASVKRLVCSLQR